MIHTVCVTYIKCMKCFLSLKKISGLLSMTDCIYDDCLTIEVMQSDRSKADNKYCSIVFAFQRDEYVIND